MLYFSNYKKGKEPRRFESGEDQEKAIEVDFIEGKNLVQITQPAGDRDYLDDHDIIIADAQQIRGLIQYLTECLAEIEQ